MDAVHEVTTPSRKVQTLRLIGAVCLILIVTVGVEAGYALAYEGRIYPGVRVGSLSVGGLSRSAATTLLEKEVERRLVDGLKVTVAGKTAKLDLDVIAKNDPDLTRSAVQTDITSAVESAYAIGRDDHPFFNLLFSPLSLVERPVLSITLNIDEPSITNQMREAFAEYAEEPAPTSFLITKEANAWRVAIVEGKERTVLGTDVVFEELNRRFGLLSVSSPGPVPIPLVVNKPLVTLEEAAAQIPDVEAILATAPFSLVYTNTRGMEQRWELSAGDLSGILAPSPTGVEMPEETLLAFLELIEARVNVPAQDARLELGEDGARAQTFVPSQNGQEVNRELTMERIRAAVAEMVTEPIPLAVNETLPHVPLASANDLGINELLGTGVSDYKGSPGNRIKNIRNGVRLLNGILIPPGETFSLLAALRPFTTGNGYLPELVIKGDKIIPEIGGGLCQIGSTTFRAAMMSGLPIVERQNHSLVVTYYNDPSNGNPGTDATIYEPAPDMKFQNNTPAYILFEAVMDETEKKLYFSFWGTSDGRKGSYSPPVVDEWFGMGNPRMIETPDLAPGITQCQSGHPGALAHFTYTIEQPDGTKTERVFTSRYRSLPKICLVGVDPTATPPPPEAPVSAEPIPVSEL